MLLVDVIVHAGPVGSRLERLLVVSREVVGSVWRGCQSVSRERLDRIVSHIRGVLADAWSCLQGQRLWDRFPASVTQQMIHQHIWCHLRKDILSSCIFALPVDFLALVVPSTYCVASLRAGPASCISYDLYFDCNMYGMSLGLKSVGSLVFSLNRQDCLVLDACS